MLLFWWPGYYSGGVLGIGMQSIHVFRCVHPRVGRSQERLAARIQNLIL